MARVIKCVSVYLWVGGCVTNMYMLPSVEQFYLWNSSELGLCIPDKQTWQFIHIVLHQIIQYHVPLSVHSICIAQARLQPFPMCTTNGSCWTFQIYFTRVYRSPLKIREPAWILGWHWQNSSSFYASTFCNKCCSERLVHTPDEYMFIRRLISCWVLKYGNALLIFWHFNFIANLPKFELLLSTSVCHQWKSVHFRSVFFRSIHPTNQFPNNRFPANPIKTSFS